jgi:DNA-binding NarL/FixJ family response regulator
MNRLALAAHLRMVAAFREKTSTHTWAPIIKQWGYRRTKEEMASLRIELQRMDAQGLTRKEMCSRLQCTNATIKNCLGPSKHTGRYKKAA